MKSIKTLIVDDEKEARDGVSFLLQKDADVEVIGMCKNGVEAVRFIQENTPDLVFLDIQMPGVNGFEVLNSIPKEKLPAVIFITAYDQYSLKAFEVHAVDYLLKPFTDERFFQALDHAKAFLNGRASSKVQEALVDLLAAYENQARNQPGNQLGEALSPNKMIFNDRLVIKADGKIHFVPLKDIIWVQAFDYYIKVHVSNRFYLVRERLKKMEATLPPNMFLRIHKSSLVNINAIQELTPHLNNEYIVTLLNGQKLKISRSYRERLKDFFDF